MSEALLAVMRSAGADTSYGMKLPAALRALGLRDVEAHGHTRVQPAPEAAHWLAPVFQRMRDAMIGSGRVSVAEYKHVLGELHDGESQRWVFAPMLISASGRRARE